MSTSFKGFLTCNITEFSDKTLELVLWELVCLSAGSYSWVSLTQTRVTGVRETHESMTSIRFAGNMHVGTYLWGHTCEALS